MIANVHTDRRREQRLRYSWDTHVYFTNQRGGTLARMIDLNSEAASLLLDRYRDLEPGQEVELSLNYPKVTGGRFEIVQDRMWGTVRRTQDYNEALNRVLVAFHRQLDDPPGVENEYVLH